MKLMKAITTAGLLALFVGGAALPVNEAEAVTRCRDVYTHGVHKRICTTRPAYRDNDYRPDYRRYSHRGYGHRGYGHRGYDHRGYDRRVVCRTYWRDGARYRNCRPARGRW
ncbi:MAG: hypothetical protein WAU60_10755 [Candidatus Competibacter denitrificans]|jgi:hypothetical protein